MSEAQAVREALRRAIRVRRSLDQFLESCENWLEVRNDPAGPLANYWLRCLSPIEGLPEVYPFADALLDALGPGSRYDVVWFPPGMAPSLRAALGDVAYHARDLIVKTWGWPQGLDTAILRGLVEVRKRVGCPTMREQLAESLAKQEETIERSIPAELRYQCHAEPGPFSEPIPPEKREQFDRIVQYQLDRMPKWLPPFAADPDDELFDVLKAAYEALKARFEASPLGQAERLMRSVDRLREMTFLHIDDLDSFERELHADETRPEAEADRIRKAEYDRYQNEPIIGRQAARIEWRTMTNLYLLSSKLDGAIAERRRSRSEPKGTTTPSAPPVTIETPTDTARVANEQPASRPPSTPDVNPGSKAIGAAHAILNEGGRVSLKAACERARVDRGHVRKRYSDAAKVIVAMKRVDRLPPRGVRDARTGDIDGAEGDED